jgi:hypothetical protein
MRITPVAPVYSVSTFNGHREQAVYTPKPKEKIVQYITHNEDDLINSNMTSLRGCITASYTQLVATFGMPMKDGFDDYKSDAEWLVKFDDGTVATIYNWKDGINYCGSEHGTPTESITDWHIGGHTSLAVDYVKQALKEGV